MDDIIQKLKAIDGDILIGVSGGVDSMVLSELFFRAGKKTVLAHINYQKRGADSEADEELVRQYAFKHSLLFLCKRVHQSPEGNFQEWARNLRYDWFHSCAIQTGAKWIATAHHLDDQIETLLFRLLRNVSLGELSGIDELNRPIIRPLLKHSKQEIFEFAEKEGVPYRTDQSNMDTTYDRNYIRHVLIPALDEKNSDWRTRILDLPKLSSEFHKLTDILFKQTTDKSKLDRTAFLALPPVFQKSVLHKWIRKYIGISPSRGWFNTTDQLKTLQTGQKLQIDETFSVIRDRNIFILINSEAKPKELLLRIEEKNLGTKTPIEVGHVLIDVGMWSGKPLQNHLELDFSKISFPLTVRNWKAGDRIRPFGMKGTQLISDLLTNRKIPSHIKSRTLVIQTFEQSVSAVIFPQQILDETGVISQDVYCDSSTTKTLIICKISF